MNESHNTYLKNLCSIVVGESQSDNWDEAVKEWQVIDYRYDKHVDNCICGKENIKHIYSIKNSINGNIIKTIGSSCIHKFEQDELNKQVKLFQEQNCLMRAAIDVHDICKVPFTSEYYSRDLLWKMFKDGAFKPNSFNNYNARNDYDFLLKMFNKKSEASFNEKKKLYVLTKRYIRPWLANHWRTWHVSRDKW